ncbi:hypothetical protein SAMN05216548_104118 [Faunimonas pinastri]|uniref:Chitinase n=2 Tax=Faunimonas pinastri TaxID=1855383 RepID=A0A1H9FHA7_9HYPH|nr:hypothetical protein SAMN05216548_104118 [Faunimonas pinastri]
MRAARKFVALAGVLAAFLGGATAAGAQQCFSPQDAARLPFAIIRQAPPPPTDDARNYRFYPLTDSASLNLDRLNESRASVGKYWFQWANRCQDLGFNKGACGRNPKGNVPIDGPGGDRERRRTFFSSLDRANDCTLAQAALVLGHSQVEAEKLAARSGGKPIGEEQLRSAPPPGRLVDLCPLPARTLPPEGKGIVLDYEVQDGRTPAETTAFLQDYARLVHASAKEAILYTNPLNAPTQRFTGIDGSNAHALYRAFDRIGVQLWSRNREGDLGRSAAAQLDLLRAGGAVDPKRLILVYELRGTDMADARTARAPDGGPLRRTDAVAKRGGCRGRLRRRYDAQAPLPHLRRMLLRGPASRTAPRPPSSHPRSAPGRSPARVRSTRACRPAG